MTKHSAPKTEEPKSQDESKKEEKASSDASPLPDEEEYEDEFDPNGFEEVDPEDLEGVDLDQLYEEYEDELAERLDWDGDSDEEPEDESSKGEKKKFKSLLSSSSDEEKEDSEDSDESQWEDSGEEEEEEEEEGKEDEGDQILLSERNLTENTPEENVRLLTRIREERERGEDRRPTLKDKEDKLVYKRDRFDFPPDPEGWREEDLRELWMDAPYEMTKPGWDPVWADEEDWNVVRKITNEGEVPPIAPFYVPYRRPYPIIPRNHYDIYSPKTVIEELDRIEEFLKWVSYIFPDGSTYEGTLWDDLAHGKGVYVTEKGLVRYEGEWLQNHMSGHGVVEVDIPDKEPMPGSNLEAKMWAEGTIISRDFMDPEDRRWLEMDMEDSRELVGDDFAIPFYEKEEWVKQFGRKPEKGRYKYAGQWKHGRMHGCGVYEVNERVIFGRFYFGQLLQESDECDADSSTLHAGIAEVAAAKARMFMNKPDGSMCPASQSLASNLPTW